MEQSTPRPKDSDGQPRIIYPAKLSAIMEGKGKNPWHKQPLKLYIQQNKHKENTGSSILGWRVELAYRETIQRIL